MLIKNGRIFTMAEKNDFLGYIVIEGRQIKEIGKMEDLQNENYEKIIDAEGCWVLPGFVDPHCHIGMFESGVSFGPADVNETTDPVTPHVRAIDGLFCNDRSFNEAKEAGITTLVTGPGSANVIGGQFCAVKPYGNTLEEMLLKEPVAMKCAFGENPKKAYGEQKKMPRTRMASAAVFRQALMEAKKYKETDPKDRVFDFKKEELSKVFDGLLVKIHAHRADDILTAVRLSKEFNLNITIEHCTEGYMIKDELKKYGVKPIVGPLFTFRTKHELLNASIKNPGILQQTGLKTAIMTDHPVIPVQYLPLCAGVAVKEGMDMMEALKAITIHAAQLCEIDDRVGSLEVGKDADVAIFDANPLETMTKCLYTIINGKVVYER